MRCYHCYFGLPHGLWCCRDGSRQTARVLVHLLIIALGLFLLADQIPMRGRNCNLRQIESMRLKIFCGLGKRVAEELLPPVDVIVDGLCLIFGQQKSDLRH